MKRARRNAIAPNSFEADALREVGIQHRLNHISLSEPYDEKKTCDEEEIDEDEESNDGNPPSSSSESQTTTSSSTAATNTRSSILEDYVGDDDQENARKRGSLGNGIGRYYAESKESKDFAETSFDKKDFEPLPPPPQNLSSSPSAHLRAEEKNSPSSPREGGKK